MKKTADSASGRFVIREIPAETFLDSRLRYSAHQVLGLLWSKADVQTGELRIGSHWFTQHELVRMARKLNISERTFRNVLHDQLIPCGYVRELDREYLPHTDTSGRNRKVLGPQHYVVFKTSQEPHGQRKIRKAKPKQKPTEQASSSGQKLPLEENVYPPDDSTSGKNVPVEEKSSTSGNSTTLLDLPDSTSIEAPPTSAVPLGGGGGGQKVFERVLVDSHPVIKSPQAKPDEREKTAPTPSLLKQAENIIMQGRPESERLAVQIALEIIESRETDPHSAAYYVTSFTRLSQEDHSLVAWYLKNPASNGNREKFNARLRQAIAIADRDNRPAWIVLHELTQPSKPSEDAPLEEQVISYSQYQSLWRHSKKNGWTQRDVHQFLISEYAISSPKDLRIGEYNRALKTFKAAPPRHGDVEKIIFRHLDKVSK